MNRIAKYGLLLVVAVLIVLVGCNPGPGAVYEVGDALPGGFTVSQVDDLGGYIATRDFDADGDDVVDEEQAVISGRFGDDVTFDADRVYYLEGAVTIGNGEDAGNTLTIPAGTVIKGQPSTTNPGLLLITRGSQINAAGTATNPIVFTSAREAGTRAPGDWGGIVINGFARVQGGTAEGEGNTGTYGGGPEAADAVDDDNSGTLTYVRVEFAGTLFSPDNELNGIAFQGVGSGTTVNHIQVHQNADDGVEFFGGSVQATNVVLTGNQDDSLDFDDGWNGSAQFVIIQQYPANDHGIEGDGDAENIFAPANPILANFTYVGSGDADDAFRFKVSANPSIYNSILANVAAGENAIDNLTTDDGEVENAGDITIVSVYSDGAIEDTTDVTTTTSQFESATAYTSFLTGTDVAIDSTVFDGVADGAQVPFPFGAADTSASPVTAGTVPTSDPAGNTVVNTDYVGAVDPDATSDWFADWTSFPKN